MKREKTDAKVQYQWQPRGQQRCDRCSMYRSPRQCTAVNGEISPRGWCKIFEWKEIAA